jgi:hypothetical protein
MKNSAIHIFPPYRAEKEIKKTQVKILTTVGISFYVFLLIPSLYFKYRVADTPCVTGVAYMHEIHYNDFCPAGRLKCS